MRYVLVCNWLVEAAGSDGCDKRSAGSIDWYFLVLCRHPDERELFDPLVYLALDKTSSLTE